ELCNGRNPSRAQQTQADRSDTFGGGSLQSCAKHILDPANGNCWSRLGNGDSKLGLHFLVLAVVHPPSLGYSSVDLRNLRVAPSAYCYGTLRTGHLRHRALLARRTSHFLLPANRSGASFGAGGLLAALPGSWAAR